MLTILSLFICNFFQPYETPTVKYLTPIEIAEENSGLEGIDCIYMINLDRRPEKWEKMKALFDERGLHVNRVSAIDGWKLPLEVQLELAGPYEISLRPGSVGCLLSHVSVIKDALDRGFDCVWVCEDDILFKQEAGNIPRLIKILSKKDPDWDIFYTDKDSFKPSKRFLFRPDQPHKKPWHYTKRKSVTEEISTTGLRYGTYSMVLSKKGIKKILDYFSHVYLWAPIDWDIHYIPHIREYSSVEPIVTVDASIKISDTKPPRS